MKSNSASTLIFGSTSGIAEAFARRRATQGKSLILVGRDPTKLDLQRTDLLTRGASEVKCVKLDFLAFATHPEFVRNLFESNEIDEVLLAQGCLFDQDESEKDFAKAYLSIELNFASVVSLCNAMIPFFEKQKSGQLAVLSSVAGDRGRRSNYIYGATKAAVQAYVSGLRARLFEAGVNVIDIRPGMVETKMTAHLKKGVLMAHPDRVATGIERAFRCRANVVYLPPLWRVIMLIIRSLPDFVFKRLKF